MKPLRCSSLPMASQCCQSVFVDDTVPAIGSDSTAAQLGRAIHELAAFYVRTGDMPTIAMRNEVAVKYSIPDPEGDLHWLTWAAKEAYDEVRRGFEPDPMIEVALRGMIAPDIELTGHADLLRFDPSTETVNILDYKSGRKQTDYYPQLAGYNVLSFLEFPSAKRVVAHLAWLREKALDTFTWTRAEADQWLKEFLAHMDTGVYQPGEACRWCPRQGACPARVAIVRSTLSALTQKDFPPITLTKEEWQALQPTCADIWQRAHVVEDVLERFKDFIRESISKFGPLSLTDQTELQLVPVAAKKTIKTLPAWGVLTEKLTDEELAPCITVSLSEAKDAVAKKVGRGEKKMAKEILVAELAEAGAIEEKPSSSRLVEKRKETTGGTSGAQE